MKNHRSTISRRQMLALCKNGFGGLALMGLMSSVGCGGNASRQTTGLIKPLPHYLPKAKSVIFLYMDGGISQVDSFDPKPRLAAENGEDPYRKFEVDATDDDGF